MLAEGVPPAMIENAGRQAGMPVGPLSLNDEVALDLVPARSPRRRRRSSGPGAVDPAQKTLLVELVETPGPARAQEPQGLLRLSREARRSACGPA